MLKKYIIAIIFLGCCTLTALAADLPSKGKTAPASVLQGPTGPPTDPDNPAPIGGGLIVLLGLSAAYFSYKTKSKKG